MEKINTRVRFAPSPTGALHVGGAHTALFNWLYARHTGGSFILRIEDTDKERNRPEYEQTILDGMKWLGLDWDEGPQVGGDFGPYRQSERLDIYAKYAQELIDKGAAYEADGAIFFKVPSGKKIIMEDMVYGQITVNSENASVNQDGSIKDIVLIKKDGLPAYNYAVVIDDHTMGITCVIRGEDHIINTPKQLLIYDALGLQPPSFAHLPMILGKDKKKLSKRHGAASVFDLRAAGYIPQGVFNFLGLLGWSGADGKEIFSKEEAVRYFDIADITKKPAVFDTDKLNHVNQEQLKALSPTERLALIRPFWCASSFDLTRYSDKYLEDALTLLCSRAKTTIELAEYTDYFLSFGAVTNRYDGADLTQEAKEKLRPFFNALLEVCPFESAALESFTKDYSANFNIAIKELAMPLRWCLSGRKVSPGVFDIAELLGKEECQRRLEFYTAC